MQLILKRKKATKIYNVHKLLHNMLLCTLHILLYLILPITLQIDNTLKSLHVKFPMTSKIYLQRNSSGNNSTSRKVVIKTSRNFYQHTQKNLHKITGSLRRETYKSKKSRTTSNYRFLIIKGQITVPSSCIQI